VAVLYGGEQGETEVCLLRLDQGQLVPAGTVQPAHDFPETLVAADMNGDGIDDLVLGYQDAVEIYLSIPGSRGGVTPVPTSPATPGLVKRPAQPEFRLVSTLPVAQADGRVAVGDFNADSRQDLAIGCAAELKVVYAVPLPPLATPKPKAAPRRPSATGTAGPAPATAAPPSARPTVPSTSRP
jgi:hypothetical protein